MPISAKKPALALGATALIVLGASGISARASTAGTTGTTPAGQRGPGANSAALATALGVSQTALDAATAKIRSSETKPDPATEQATQAAAIADALGVSADTVKTVLAAQTPAGGPGGKGGPQGTTPTATTPTGEVPPAGGRGPGGPGGHGPRGVRNDTALVAALVKATGKDESAVKAALTKVDATRDAARAARDADFAKKLADALGLDQAKVTAAITASRPTPPSRPATTTTTTK